MLLVILHGGTPDRLADALLSDRRHLLPVSLVCLWVLRHCRCRCRYKIKIHGRPLGRGLGESRGEHRGMTAEVARVAALRRECCLLVRWRCKRLLVPEVQQLLALFLLLVLHLLLVLALLLLEVPLQGMVCRGKCPVLLTLGFKLSLQGSKLLFCSLYPGRQWWKVQIMTIHGCNTWKPTILGREGVIIGGASKADAYRFLKRKS